MKVVINSPKPKEVEASDLPLMEICTTKSSKDAFYMRINIEPLDRKSVAMLRIKCSSSNIGTIWYCPANTAFIIADKTELTATFS